ncbi:proline racemase family protein [Octadecabacter sp. G9-8]|uniref:Proline racemase family protein n=1 Tax=Octadecabacter dasysiphoniae TaxID=2909341 RepID=A0ABS9CZZ8_9RHOB|nr:proline racemase family protein [Octadecabacter dasysiphoniae]MCF2871638.1 proline racemase family protein [Octadecabacter dasysiphoniae]
MKMARMITAVEAHAEGEGGRVITGGMPHLKGNSVFEKMQYMQRHHDDIRLLMLREPRGNPALCCNVIVPPCDPTADAGFIIMEQTEYAPMSGSNAICVTTVLLETGIVPMVEPVTTLRLEAPAGVIEVKATCKDGKVERVEFMNVPAFAAHIGVPLDVAGFGHVSVDIAWGGMWFVMADAAQFGLDPTAENGGAVVRAIEAMRDAAAQQYPVVHPDNPDLTGPTIGALTAPPTDPATHGRGAISVSSGAFDPARPEALTGALDRSPCGTGTCAKLAVLHAKGLLGVGEDYVNAGPLGTTFTGRVERVTKVGPYDAIVPSLSGRGWIHGVSQWMVDPTDPFPQGYTVGDIWG